MTLKEQEGWESRHTGILTTREDGVIEYKCLNEWQLCPKCNGEGDLPDPFINNEFAAVKRFIECDLCNGKKIISKINGQPPV